MKKLTATLIVFVAGLSLLPVLVDAQTPMEKEMEKTEQEIRGAELPTGSYAWRTKFKATNFNAETSSSGGLSTTTFTAPEGRIIAYLPSDMRAGETISGTAVIAPNGRSTEQCATNLKTLSSFGLTIAKGPVTKFDESTARLVTDYELPNWSNYGEDVKWSCVIGAYYLVVTLPVGEGFFQTQLKNEKGDEATITLNTSSDSTSAEKLKTLTLPTVGQNGRNVRATGPFDGNLRNTEIKIGGQTIPTLAESPRTCIFKSPAQNFGPTEITVKENNVEAKGPYRNLGVRLSAPKTNLLKGEKTTVTITVSGLKGIQQNVPLLLEKKGDVSMEGGDVQTIQIRPSDVVIEGVEANANVRKVVVGLRPGVFNITATVIDPRIRPIIIPLIENGSVNGYRVEKDGNGFVVNAEKVKSPITGDAVDGKHKLEHRCPNLSQLPIVKDIFMNKGVGKTKTDCLVIITPRIIVQDEH